MVDYVLEDHLMCCCGKGTSCGPEVTKMWAFVTRSDKKAQKITHRHRFSACMQLRKTVHDNQTLQYLWSLKLQVDSLFTPGTRGHSEETISFVANASKQNTRRLVQSEAKMQPSELSALQEYNSTEHWLWNVTSKQWIYDKTLNLLRWSGGIALLFESHVKECRDRACGTYYS